MKSIAHHRPPSHRLATSYASLGLFWALFSFCFHLLLPLSVSIASDLGKPISYFDICSQNGIRQIAFDDLSRTVSPGVDRLPSNALEDLKQDGTASDDLDEKGTICPICNLFTGKAFPLPPTSPIIIAPNSMDSILASLHINERAAHLILRQRYRPRSPPYSA